MKYSNLRAFEKHLEGAVSQHSSDVYMILSKEDFERKAALDLIIKTILRKEATPDFCQHTFDAEKHTIDNILNELETLSLFVKKRLVIVQNVDKFDKAANVKMEAYFAAPNHTTCLVLVSPSLNRTTNFYKKAEKVGVVLDIAEEKPWEREKSLADWLRATAAAEGKQIELPTCRVLIKQLGTDQALLHQELLKLLCYVGKRPDINEKDVAAICGSINSENAWQLGEAIFRRDPATALRISKALLNDGVALIALLRQIRSQFQTEFNICSILMQGGSGEDIMREYPYMKGQILERHMHNARNYGISSLTEGILKIDQAELQAKNSSMDPDFLAEMLIINLALHK